MGGGWYAYNSNNRSNSDIIMMKFAWSVLSTSVSMLQWYLEVFIIDIVNNKMLNIILPKLQA